MKKVRAFGVVTCCFALSTVCNGANQLRFELEQSAENAGKIIFIETYNSNQEKEDAVAKEISALRNRKIDLFKYVQLRSGGEKDFKKKYVSSGDTRTVGRVLLDEYQKKVQTLTEEKEKNIYGVAVGILFELIGAPDINNKGTELNLFITDEDKKHLGMIQDGVDATYQDIRMVYQRIKDDEVYKRFVRAVQEKVVLTPLQRYEKPLMKGFLVTGIVALTAYLYRTRYKGLFGISLRLPEYVIQNEVDRLAKLEGDELNSEVFKLYDRYSASNADRIIQELERVRAQQGL